MDVDPGYAALTPVFVGRTAEVSLLPTIGEPLLEQESKLPRLLMWGALGASALAIAWFAAS